MKDLLIKQLATNYNLIEEIVSEVINTLASHYEKSVEVFIANIFVSDQARKSFVGLYCETVKLLELEA